MPFIVVRYDEHGIRRVLADEGGADRPELWHPWPDTHDNYRAPVEARRYVTQAAAARAARQSTETAFVRLVLR